MRRLNPLYLLAGLLAIATVVFAFATVSSGPPSSGRTGSVYDDGAGGAAALRHYLEAMGATTTNIPRPSRTAAAIVVRPSVASASALGPSAREPTRSTAMRPAGGSAKTALAS